MIIDFHTHAFPDGLADRAMAQLEQGAGVKGRLDGRVSSLVASMDRAGIARSVVLSIATKPAQFEPILEWSRRVASERIVPFPSVHPADPEAVAHIRRIRSAGFRGLKLHPYYQEFDLAESRMDPLYRAIEEEGLILECHTGFDIAFPRHRIADPVRVAEVVRRHPGLHFVATHLGGWEDWDEVRRHLLGKPIYIEVSLSLAFLGPERMTELLGLHGRDYLIFGTDSPWDDQTEAIDAIRKLGLDAGIEDALFHRNAARLLAAAGNDAA